MSHTCHEITDFNESALYAPTEENPGATRAARERIEKELGVQYRSGYEHIESARSKRAYSQRYRQN
ncbi:protein of unknown function [Paenibacillus alvei]|uniref:Uncharacterized protein n=1 Tax=Paenibacillus alvei TaxID=44250 RepID=A0A383RCE6_PAEAL|nr:protein of unknown function [Paenibacillus alvei]